MKRSFKLYNGYKSYNSYFNLNFITDITKIINNTICYNKKKKYMKYNTEILTI